MIVNSAIKMNGKIYIGRRHHIIINENPFGFFKGKDAVQGFIDAEGNFLDRKEAAKIAIESGQVKEENMTVKGTLFSEDLW